MMRELPINPPEPAEVTYCLWCQDEIYEGDEVCRAASGDGYVHDGDCSQYYAEDIAYDGCGVIDRNKNIE